MNGKIEAIAERVFQAQRQKHTYTNLTGEQAPSSIDEAYAVQRALHARQAQAGRGPVGGRKIALAARVQQQLCGINHPIAGGIYAREIYQSPCALVLSDYFGLGVEYEICVTLNRDVSGAQNHTRDSVRGLIGSVRPAFELISDRGADYADLQAISMIADNAWCAGVVLGPELDPQAIDRIDELSVRLQWNDEAPQTGTSGASDPLSSLAWVINLVCSAGDAILADQPVITGSVFKTRYPVAGDTLKFVVDEQSEVSLAID